MSEDKKTDAGTNGGGVAGKGNAPVASSVPLPAVPVAGPSHPDHPTRFGGKPGKGRTREDGLKPGSPEAKAADLEKDRLRKKAERAALKTASQSPPLPSVAAPAMGEGGAMAYDIPALLDAPAVLLDSTAPTFVPWQARMLQKPVELITKILDKIRCYSVMAKVKKLGLSKEQLKEIEEDMRWKTETVKDFNTALVEVAQIELNKRRVPGANHSHWVTLAMAGGEMAVSHIETLNKLERMILLNKSLDKAPTN